MTHRPPTRFDTGREVEVAFNSDDWRAAMLQQIVHEHNRTIYRAWICNLGARETDFCRVPYTCPDPVAELSAAADWLAERDMNEAARVLMLQPEFLLLPLEWSTTEHGDGDISCSASTPFGSYSVICYDGEFFWSFCFDEYYDEGRCGCESLEDGKAKAWQHWVGRISPMLRKLTPNPEPQ